MSETRDDLGPTLDERLTVVGEEIDELIAERDRLLASNRELLAALQGCRDWIVNCPDMNAAGTAASQQRYVLAEIDEAIAKAGSNQ